MKNLKELRTQKKISQQTLAYHLNISQQSVYKYENDIAEPDISTLKKMADFFETSIDYLVGYTDISQKHDYYVEDSLNSDELRHITLYRKLSPSKRKALTHFLEEFIK